MLNYFYKIFKKEISNATRIIEKKRFLYNHILTPNPKTCYCRIPKNACTLIRFGIAAKFKFIDISKPLEAIEWVNKNTEFLVKNSKNNEKFHAPNQFVVLRDPFSRVVSSFLDRVVGNKDKIADLILLKKKIKLDGSTNFEDFVEEVLPHIYLENPHFVPQNLFMRKKINYNYKINIKDLNKIIKTGQLYDLMNIEDYQTDILSQHTTSIKLKLEVKDAYKIPLKELKFLKKNSLTVNDKNFFSEKAKKIINQLYAKDYEILNTIK